MCTPHEAALILATYYYLGSAAYTTVANCMVTSKCKQTEEGLPAHLRLDSARNNLAALIRLATVASAYSLNAWKNIVVDTLLPQYLA